MLHLRGWRATAIAAVVALAAPAHAALYQYASGAATITASSPAGTLGTATFSLNGIFAEFDPDSGQLTNFQFTTTPNQWIVLNAVYGGFDQIWVNSASVVPGPGYATLSSTLISPGHWNVSVLPVVVNATYTGKNSGTGATSPTIPLSYTNATPLNATIDVLERSFTLQGITLGIIPVPGESPVTVGAVLTFQGATPVPEPAVFGLFAVAGLALAFARSRARCA